MFLRNSTGENRFFQEVPGAFSKGRSHGPIIYPSAVPSGKHKSTGREGFEESMAEDKPDRIRLKRPGGPAKGSPAPLNRQKEEEERPLTMEDREAVIPPGSVKEKSANLSPGENPEPDGAQIYNLELVIYTVSGHKYSARLNFRSDVESGRMVREDVLAMIQKVESDIRNRTFQRPITYSDTRGGGATVEYIFTPENVECVGIVRKY